MALRIRISSDATSWDNIEGKLLRGLANIAQFAGIHFVIGSNLPYASHWIEEGWRDDPRLGRVTVNYRSPPGTQFMHKAARTVLGKGHKVGFRLRRPSESVFGLGFVPVAFMAQYGEAIVDEMQDNLQKSVYSRGAVGTNQRSGRSWVRSHALYNSIQARRV